MFSPKEKFNVLFFKHNEAPGLHGRNGARNVHAESRVHENSCALLIPLPKDNMNQSIFFSTLCLVASFSRPSCCHTRSLAAVR